SGAAGDGDDQFAVTFPQLRQCGLPDARVATRPCQQQQLTFTLGGQVGPLKLVPDGTLDPLFALSHDSTVIAGGMADSGSARQAQASDASMGCISIGELQPMGEESAFVCLLMNGIDSGCTSPRKYNESETPLASANWAKAPCPRSEADPVTLLHPCVVVRIFLIQGIRLHMNSVARARIVANGVVKQRSGMREPDPGGRAGRFRPRQRGPCAGAGHSVYISK